MINGVQQTDPKLIGPVIAYMAAIAAMVTVAAATGNVLATVGAGLFMFSDSLIAINRFVKPMTWAPMAIIVTYHLGQAGLVASLLTSIDLANTALFVDFDGTITASDTAVHLLNRMAGCLEGVRGPYRRGRSAASECMARQWALVDRCDPS